MTKCKVCGVSLPYDENFCYECEIKMEAFEYEYKLDSDKYILIGLKDTSITDLVIPRVFSKIREEAFSCCSNLKSVIITDSVTKIGEEAFLGCSSLKSITLADSVTEIERGLFWGCSDLENIIIPASVTKIGLLAFVECSNLKSITIPASVTEIGDEAFAMCSLKNVLIENPNFKKSDIRRVFGYSPILKELKIGNKIIQVSDLD